MITQLHDLLLLAILNLGWRLVEWSDRRLDTRSILQQLKDIGSVR